MKVLVLMGIPGSGKSTYSKQFTDAKVINQDLLGSRNRCLEEFNKALQSGTNLIIVDRCNINKQQRRLWINSALQAGVESLDLVWLDIPEEEAIARIEFRKDHPTITDQIPLDKKRSIVYSFNNDLEYPTLDEGFTSIVIKRG